MTIIDRWGLRSTGQHHCTPVWQSDFSIIHRIYERYGETGKQIYANTFYAVYSFVNAYFGKSFFSTFIYGYKYFLSNSQTNRCCCFGRSLNVVRWSIGRHTRHYIHIINDKCRLPSMGVFVYRSLRNTVMNTNVHTYRH